jgi:hypothetical protein
MGSLLAVVLLFFIIAFVVVIARHVLSSQVRGTAQSAALGTLAQEIVRSAVEEASVEVQRLLNDPRTDLFRTLRKQDGSPVVFFKAIPIPHTKALVAADELLRGFEVEGWTIQTELMGRRPLGRVVYENLGTFRFTGAVRHRSTGVRRQIQLERSYKMTLMSTPLPYDQFSVLVLNPSNLIEKQTGWLNAQMDFSRDTMKKLIEEKVPAYIKQLQDTIREGNDAMARGRGYAASNANAASGVTDPGGELREDVLIKPIREAQLRPTPFIGDSFEPPRDWSPDKGPYYHHLPANLVIATKASRIDDLSICFVRSRIEKLESERLEPVIRQYNRTDQEFWLITNEMLALARSTPSQAEIQAAIDRGRELHEKLKVNVRQLKADLEAVSRSCGDLLDEELKFTDFFIEMAEGKADWARSYVYKLDLDDWRAKATFLFEGDGCSERFLKFLREYNAKGQPLNGVVFIVNPRPEDDLKLVRMQITGKLVIVTTGNAVVQEVSLLRQENDLLTICCGGQLKATGLVQASLIPRKEFKPKDLRLDGNLIFEKVENPEDLAGSLTNPHVRDDKHGRYFSGYRENAAPEYLYAAWSPWSAWTQIQRY